MECGCLAGAMMLHTHLRNYFAEECLHVHTHIWVSVLQVSQL